MSPKPARETIVESAIMADPIAGILIAPNVSMMEHKETVNSLHGRASWLRRMEYLMGVLAALAVAQIVIDFAKKHF